MIVDMKEFLLEEGKKSFKEIAIPNTCRGLPWLFFAFCIISAILLDTLQTELLRFDMFFLC